jgi:hypothetical protein
MEKIKQNKQSSVTQGKRAKYQMLPKKSKLRYWKALEKFTSA